MSKPPHVAILIETSLAYGRGLLRGVARYVQEHGPWSVYFRPQGLDAPPPKWLSHWRGDGILARIDTRRMAQAVLRTRLPTVDLRNTVAGLKFPGVGPNNRAVAMIAFRQFLESGLRHFAFCGDAVGVNRYLDVRCHYFRQMVEEAGHECHMYQPKPSPRGDAWEQEQGRLVRWLKRLPMPIGIMACDDDHGRQVLDACLRAGLRVPEQVAVIGVNNDEHLCSLSNPPLSSVDVNAERIGYEAAALLDRLMAGAPPPAEIVEFPPCGLVVRQSSDMAGIADPQVADALRFIRAHAVEKIGVEDVARALDISRSTLERRFLQMLGRSPKQEILRVQLDCAQDLLTRTNLRMAAIAEKAGFQSPGYFCEVFHRRMGCTPGAYRRDHSVTQFTPGHWT